MEFVGESADGRTVRYVDTKRYLWLLSLSGPSHTVIAIVFGDIAKVNIDPVKKQHLYAKYGSMLTSAGTPS